MVRLLDTDTCVHAIRRRSGVLSRLGQLGPDEVAITAMTEAELRYGALKSDAPERAQASLEAFLVPFDVMPFDTLAARAHAELRWALRTTPIGERDLVIASIARSVGGTLVTGNLREFQRIPGLRVEDWIAR